MIRAIKSKRDEKDTLSVFVYKLYWTSKKQLPVINLFHLNAFNSLLIVIEVAPLNFEDKINI